MWRCVVGACELLNILYVRIKTAVILLRILGKIIKFPLSGFVHHSFRRTLDVLGPGFSPVTSVCLFSINRPMFRSHIRLHSALTRRTSGRNLEASKAVLFVI